MRGFNVLYSVGINSFGLPAERFAIQTGQHPRITTGQNIANMLSQLKLIGLSHDPDRRFSTTDPEYYRWTQWIFLNSLTASMIRRYVGVDRMAIGTSDGHAPSSTSQRFSEVAIGVLTQMVGLFRMTGRAQLLPRVRRISRALSTGAVSPSWRRYPSIGVRASVRFLQMRKLQRMDEASVAIIPFTRDRCVNGCFA